jgi:hypothetical protein
MSTNNPTATPTIRTNVVRFSDASCTIVGMSLGTQWSISNGQPANWPPTVTPNLSPSGNSSVSNLMRDATTHPRSPGTLTVTIGNTVVTLRMVASADNGFRFELITPEE